MIDMRMCELLNGGDWACAFAEPHGLVEVCDALAELVDDEALAGLAREIATLAPTDMGSATRQWARLAGALRHRSHARGQPCGGAHDRADC
jgi:hypothetical protein